MALICASPMKSGGEHLSMCLLAVCVSSLEKSDALPIFNQIFLCVCLFLSCVISLHALDISPLSDTGFTHRRLPFHLVDGFLCFIIYKYHISFVFSIFMFKITVSLRVGRESLSRLSRLEWG